MSSIQTQPIYAYIHPPTKQDGYPMPFLSFCTLISNSAVVAYAIYGSLRWGLPRGSEFWMVLFFLSAPITALLYMFLNRGGQESALTNLVKLEIQARKAVLQRRIDGTEHKKE